MEPMLADRHSPDGQEPRVISRITKSGRKLWYRLDVIQQPERARACGSGPKSTSDRRPVDPPPVVELRIYEGGPEFHQAKDITFIYNANFFLFCTLEHARVLAHPRGQPPQASTPPVLTGMPVSGMAYLDRPQEAGYFLFPDLSVRHEGRYRLAFNLYEETKEEKDKDEGSDSSQGASFDWRMDLRSADFTVYSAKKFPGLTSSTTLSRTMAEQGTRVRIRREVRMRRRDNNKSGADFEGAEGDASRRPRSSTPETKHEDYRSRSISGSTDRAPLSAIDAQRRPSNADLRPPPPPPPPPPGFPSAQMPPASHVPYPGHAPYAAPPPSHYPPPPSSSGHASPVPQSPSYAQHVHPAYGTPQATTPVPYHPDRRMSIHPADQQPRAYPNPSPQRENFPSDVRRLSSASYGGRPMTPQSANDAMNPKDASLMGPEPSPKPPVQLPSIRSWIEHPLTSDPAPVSAAHAKQQAQTPAPAALPPPPPPPPTPPMYPNGQQGIMIPSPPGEADHLDPMGQQSLHIWDNFNLNGKRLHPDISLGILCRPVASAKNGKRPETQAQYEHSLEYYWRSGAGQRRYYEVEVEPDGQAKDKEKEQKVEDHRNRPWMVSRYPEHSL